MVGNKKAVGESSQIKTPQAASMKLKVKTFTGNENFMLWKRRLKHALAQQGITAFSASKEKRLETMTVEWDVLDKLAKECIENFIKDEMSSNTTEDTTKQTWEKLGQVFLARSLSNKLCVKEELLNLHKKEWRNPKFKDKEGCFKYGSKDRWKQNCLIWKQNCLIWKEN